MYEPIQTKSVDLLKQLDPARKIYLGGKIRKNCWRHDLINGLRHHYWAKGPLNQDCFTYVGPFFVSCDHGCYHRQNTHGNDSGCSPDLDISRKIVAALCREALDTAELVFCYIDEKHCYGTIAEIERAHMRGIRVVIAFAPDIADLLENDFWFVCVDAFKVHFNICRCQLPDLFAQTLRELP